MSYNERELRVIEQKYGGRRRRFYDSTAQADVFGLVDTIRERTRASHSLAMLALQSDRYVQDAEYREATDAVLVFSFPTQGWRQNARNDNRK